jgi:hypothetical protein
VILTNACHRRSCKAKRGVSDPMLTKVVQMAPRHFAAHKQNAYRHNLHFSSIIVCYLWCCVLFGGLCWDITINLGTTSLHL